MQQDTKENITAWSLAAVGAVRSIPEFFHPHPEYKAMTTMPDMQTRAAHWGWAGIVAGVVAWDLMAPETLSEGVDRALKAHKVPTTIAIGATTLHLLNLIPERIDPIHQFGKRARAKIRS